MHWYAQGYFIKFEIKRVEPTEQRPHGLRYAFTLHDPDNKRIMGFDNAHTVAAAGSNAKRKIEADHWHRSEDDGGRAYKFTNAETLIDDFFAEVERILTERKVPRDVVKDASRPKPKLTPEAKPKTKLKRKGREK